MKIYHTAPALSLILLFGASGNQITFGGPGSGPNPGGGSTATKTSPKSRTHATEKPMSDRAARAKASHNPSSKAKQDASEQLENEVADKLGAVKSTDNKPMDVVIGGKHGVEVKMMHDLKESRVNMRPDSRVRKEQWAKDTGGTLHTLLVDNRDKFDGGKHADKYSGNKYYIAKGVGAFRLNTMTPVKSLAEAKAFILGGKP